MKRVECRGARRIPGMPFYFYHISLEILPDTPLHLEQFGDSRRASSEQLPLFLQFAREALHPFQKRRPKSGRGARSSWIEESKGKAGRLVLGSSESDNLNKATGGGIGNHPQLPCLAPTRTASSTSSQPHQHQQPDVPSTVSTAKHIEPATLQHLANDRRLVKLSLECIDMV